MAKPRVFVSSTYYDLKYIRANLETFIESLGYEAILSEKGEIAYSPDQPLDESCYREVRNADILVLIIGGRYGSEISGTDKKTDKGFFEKYDSITKQEYLSAVAQDIPVYILKFPRFDGHAVKVYLIFMEVSQWIADVNITVNSRLRLSV